MRRRPSIVARVAALAAALAAAAPASAAPGPLPVSLAAERGHLVAALDLSAAFQPSVERDLGNGLTNVVAIWVSVAPAAGGPPSRV